MVELSCAASSGRGGQEAPAMHTSGAVLARDKTLGSRCSHPNSSPRSGVEGVAAPAATRSGEEMTDGN